MGGESSNHPQNSSRLSFRSGKIVEVQGGHILRSTGRKDRHSKVCTAKGPRDRRVRLAAHTAIQFYDVQDRLGFDRPSKAVDWLMKMAKASIDELASLPAWHPTDCNAETEQEQQVQKNLEEQQHSDLKREDGQQHQIGNENVPNSSFLPLSLDSDTIKSLFPLCASSAVQFQNFPNLDLLSTNRSHSQDLRLSLQSFEDSILVQQQEFDGSLGWAELSRIQRLSSWNGGSGALQHLLEQDQFFSQRGSLQSSNTPSIRASIDSSPCDHSQHHYPSLPPIYPSSMSFARGICGIFPRFHIPARIEEEQGGYSDKPSSDSRH